METKEKKVKLTDELSANEIKEYNTKADELAKKYGVSKVHVYVAIEPDTKERIVGYLKEPNFTQKLFAMDKIATVGMFSAGNDLREALTLKGEGESDPRTYNTTSDCDPYRLGMTGFCIPIIEVIQNSFKKK
jgi:hypothetical protein